MPKYWERHDAGHEVAIVTVLPVVPEYEEILRLFKKTMPNSEVYKIQRVQNKVLWRRYYQQKQAMKQDTTHPSPNERQLFHGTRDTDPKQICQGNEGFDMRFANKGMWGKGNYFAENASYSHSFCHQTRDRFRQILVAKVLLGACKKMKKNSEMTKPPERDTTGRKAGQVQRRFDSVQGETNGTVVYITYDNIHSYPDYIITYR